MLCIALNLVSRIGSKDAVGCYLLSLEGHQLQSSLSIHESLALLSPIEGKNMPMGCPFFFWSGPLLAPIAAASMEWLIAGELRLPAYKKLRPCKSCMSTQILRCGISEISPWCFWQPQCSTFEKTTHRQLFYLKFFLAPWYHTLFRKTWRDAQSLSTSGFVISYLLILPSLIPSRLLRYPSRWFQPTRISDYW